MRSSRNSRSWSCDGGREWPPNTCRCSPIGWWSCLRPPARVCWSMRRSVSEDTPRLCSGRSPGSSSSVSIVIPRPWPGPVRDCSPSATVCNSSRRPSIGCRWFSGDSGLVRPWPCSPTSDVPRSSSTVPSVDSALLQMVPLDMRMGGTGPTAADLLEQAEWEELVRILRDYGEERRARAIARAIVKRREQDPLRTTAQLSRLVQDVMGGRRATHPPCDPHLSGIANRGQRRTRTARAFSRACDSQPQIRWPNRGHFVSLARRPDRQTHPAAFGGALYLPSGFSGLSLQSPTGRRRADAHLRYARTKKRSTATRVPGRRDCGQPRTTGGLIWIFPSSAPPIAF